MGTKTIRAALAAICAAAIASTVQAATTKYSAESGELVYGTYNEANPGSSTMVTTTATLAFPGITLDDITNYVFTGYIKSGAVAHPASTTDARKAIHRDANGHADKIVTQFAIWDNTGDSAHTKAVAQALAYRQALARRPDWNHEIAVTVVEVCGNAGYNWFNLRG